MIDIKLENVKEFEFKCNGLFLQGKHFEVELEETGTDSHELADELIKDLTHKLYQSIKETSTEAKAKEIIKYMLEDIAVETLNNEIKEWANE